MAARRLANMKVVESCAANAVRQAGRREQGGAGMADLWQVSVDAHRRPVVDDQRRGTAERQQAGRSQEERGCCPRHRRSGPPRQRGAKQAARQVLGGYQGGGGGQADLPEEGKGHTRPKL
jgi:hypothetical protein